MLKMLATAAAALLVSTAAHATITNTPYNPGCPTDLSTFCNGSENAAQTIVYQADPNGRGLDVSVVVDPAGAGEDMADRSLGEQFTNLYFGDEINGATIGFELGNNVAFNPSTGERVTYGANAGIVYLDVPGTSYADGGVGSRSYAFIPYVDFTTNVLGLQGFTPYLPGDLLQLRDIQAFAYAGNNAGGGERFGFVQIPSDVAAAPEPGTWALMLAGVGLIGIVLRRRREGTLAAA